MDDYEDLPELMIEDPASPNYVSRIYLHNIPDLSYLTRLEKLDLNIEINFSKLEELKKLYLNSNKIDKY